jgi:hypothetical protein
MGSMLNEMKQRVNRFSRLAVGKSFLKFGYLESRSGRTTLILRHFQAWNLFLWHLGL